MREFWADGKHPFGVTLTGGDLQQRNNLAVRLTKWAEREMGQLK